MPKKPYQRKPIRITFLLSNRSFTERGGFVITLLSAVSAPKPNAGTISVPISIVKICIIVRGTGIKPPEIRYKAGAAASGVLLSNIYLRNFRILLYTLRPSSTARTIEAKLSSLKIISAASFATSVPVIPIAIPISAFLRAGESLTPSPVTATIFPISCNAHTIRYFCSGSHTSENDFSRKNLF